MKRIKRKRKNTVLPILILVVLLCVTVGFSYLRTSLSINGKANIKDNSWNIYFDNIQILSGSVTTLNVPTISDRVSLSFGAELKKPGDFYEFTVDVVNDGTIDAMIDSFSVLPQLTEAQSKFLIYSVTYSNGQPLSKKDKLESGERKTLFIKSKFKNGVAEEDLPTSNQNFDFNININYVPDDGNGLNVSEIVLGPPVGEEVCFSTECFYVLGTDGDSTRLLAKYNLYLGKMVTSIDFEDTLLATKVDIDDPTNLQDSRAIGLKLKDDVNVWTSYNDYGFPWYGTIMFANKVGPKYYWDDNGLKSQYGSSYPAYVYDDNSYVKSYVDGYKTYLENQSVIVNEARLIRYDELVSLGCPDYYAGATGSKCANAPEFVYKTSYWTGSAFNETRIWNIDSTGHFNNDDTGINEANNGIRPLIVVPTSIIR